MSQFVNENINLQPENQPKQQNRTSPPRRPAGSLGY